ncbi:hypothetical protein FRC07_006011 [Ceratobasidium sp. 392]|nr:hypothetical protein FRC07_006011 [Ceratobasidium sp. 392]
MFQLPALEYNLSHPHPKGHVFFIATVVVFILALPVLVIVNIVTLGSELVPSLQAEFQPNDTLLEGWWGTHRLPRLLRPKLPLCQPQDLGRGDKFRLSASLFDYTVMSTWNTSKSSNSGIQEQHRVEYRGQSFADCSVNNTRFDFSAIDQTQTVTVGVVCPNSTEYPVFVSMETSMVFAQITSKDFIGQYYGPGLDLLNLTQADPSDYRKLVLGVLELISTDSITIMRGPHLQSPALSFTLFSYVNPDTAILDNRATTFTHANGTMLPYWPPGVNIYAYTIANLLDVVVDAVNLDLGSHRYPNMFTNASVLRTAVWPNKAPNGTQPDEWAMLPDAQSLNYGKIKPPYQTWAEMLLNGDPFKLGTVTGRPNNSVMVTTYLCPMYQVKRISSLLTSVFVGTATMTLSAWSVWMLVTAFLAKRMDKPDVQCHCKACQARRKENNVTDAEGAVSIAKDEE